jgi:IS30 family transposase
MTEEEWVALDNFVTPLIKRGQPVSHIYNTVPEKIPCARSTFYRYVSSGVLSLKNIDMRRVVRYKRRKKPVVRRKRPYGLIGRMYSDFLIFTGENPHLHIWEMDTVIGKKSDEKVMLTLFSRTTRLMLIFLLPEKTQGSVIFALDMLEEQCGVGLFQSVFQVILTDNGSEFMDYASIERSAFDESRRTWLFYCDPYSSYQKAGIEKNHEYIRYVLPKGTSFDDLSWYDVTMLASHINSVARDSLDGLCPIKAFERDYDPPLLNHVYLMHVNPLEVNLTPDLLLDR